ITCDECRAAMVDVATIAAELQDEEPPVPVAYKPVVPPRPAGWLWYVTAGIAALLVLAVGVRQVWLSPQRQVNRAMATLISAVGTNRFTQARLSEPFANGAAPSPLRGPADPLPGSVERAAIELEALADRTRTAETLRGAAVGHLVRGRLDD